MTPNMTCIWPLSRSGIALELAAIRDVDEIDAGHHLEQFAGDMQRRADAAGRHVDLAGIGLGIGDEFRDRLRRHVRIHLHHQRNERNARHGCGVVHEVEMQVAVDRRVDRVGGHGKQQRVAVRRRFHRIFGSDVAARSGPIVNHDRLAEPVRQPLRHQPADDVGRAAGRNLHDQMNRPRRVVVGPGDMRHCWGRGGSRRQYEKIPA